MPAVTLSIFDVIQAVLLRLMFLLSQMRSRSTCSVPCKALDPLRLSPLG